MAKRTAIRIDSSTKAIITGASSGIGAALAIAMGKRGASVVLIARRRDRLEAVAEQVREAGGTAYVRTADISKRDEAEAITKNAVESMGGVDVLVNNAGRGNMASVEDTTQEMIESMFALNVYALWYTTGVVLPHMKAQRKGHIVNISSVAGTMAFPFNSAYVAAKHACTGFTAALRSELVETGVEASAVYPAGVETEWGDVTEGGAIGSLFFHGIKNSRKIARERDVDLAPLSPMIPAEEVAQIIIDSIENPQRCDIFTHNGTLDHAVHAIVDRPTLEQRFTPVYLGMRKSYEEL